MQRVAVIGCGITKFKARWLEKTCFELAFDATKEALRDAGVTIDKIETDGVKKVKPGARAKAAFKEHRDGLVTDFIFQLAD